MSLSIKEQKVGAYSVAVLSIPATFLIPSIPLALLVGAVGVGCAGFAYSITVNTAKINAEINEIKALKVELEGRHSDALAVKAELKELRKRQVIELEDFKNKAESEVLDHKEALQKAYGKKLSSEVEKLEKEYLQKSKDYRSIQVARLAYVIREKEALEDYMEAERLKEVSEYQGAFQEFQQVLVGFESQLKEAQTDFRASYTAKTEEIGKLHQTLSKTNNVRPFNGSDKASIVGNKVLDYFLRNGITLDGERCETKLDSSILYLRPRGTTIKAVEAHLEAIYLYFELVSLPRISADSGCIRLVLQDATIKLPAKIKEPPIQRFIDALQASNHIRLTAPTDSGKSSLLDNILGIYSDIYEGKQGLTLLDPKYPFTEWAGHKPDYKGFDECLGAMSLLQVKIEKRLSEAKALAEAGKEIPDYEAELFAIDELELLYSDALTADGEKKGDVTKALSKAINTGLKMGRGLTKTKGKGIKVLYVTQSPLCTKIGQNKDAFDQSTSIYLGSNIPLVLQDSGELDGKITAAKRKAIEKEYNVRIAANQQYLMLVRLPNGGDVFLMQAPKPGQFVPVLPETKALSAEASPTKTVGCACPDCGTISTKKNGKYKSRQRWKCLSDSCDKNSFTED